MAMVARVVKFDRPYELPNEEESATGNDLEPVKAMEIKRQHEHYSHPSVIKLKRMANEWFKDPKVTQRKIGIRHAKEGKFCSSCVEGKLKEHARKACLGFLPLSELLLGLLLPTCLTALPLHLLVV